MKGKSKYVTMKPEDSRIANYIAYYYFHSSDDPLYSEEFSYYPHFRNALTIYRGSEVVITDTSSLVTPADSDKITVIYSKNFSYRIDVKLNGRFNKIGVVFNPLGFNHFLKVPLKSLLADHVVYFDYFGEELEELAEFVFNQEDREKGVRLLDLFFKSKFNYFNEDRLIHSVKSIHESQGTVKVTTLATELNVDRKTLLRDFDKHLVSSVGEYKKLVKFRLALDSAMNNLNERNLTEIATGSAYYDQPDFIKNFKSLTSWSPQSFLKRTDRIGGEDTYWTFKK